MNRREFLNLIGTSPLIISSLLSASPSKNEHDRRIIVLVELKGGNDGLNTLVPFTQREYYKERPTLSIPKSSLIQLNQSLGMNPSLKELKKLWDNGDMAWLPGVGYPNPNRSHFKSIDIWNHATFHDAQIEGWLTQHLPPSTLTGVAINTNLGPLSSQKATTLNIKSVQEFLSQEKIIRGTQSATNNTSLKHILSTQSKIDKLDENMSRFFKKITPPKYPFPNGKGTWNKSLHSVYSLISSGLPVPAYKISLAGFDTHFFQEKKHQRLLKELANGLDLLSKNLQVADCWDEVIIMTYSEFGRRVAQNESNGTDHGTAAPHMILGGKVKGGIYGKYPSLQNLDTRGDLIYTTDFRDIYGTLLKKWFSVSTSLSGSLEFI